jgi:hypothetical protein
MALFYCTRYGTMFFFDFVNISLSNFDKVKKRGKKKALTISKVRITKVHKLVQRFKIWRKPLLKINLLTPQLPLKNSTAG